MSPGDQGGKAEGSKGRARERSALQKAVFSLDHISTAGLKAIPDGLAWEMFREITGT